jgi:hypothetical protein
MSPPSRSPRFSLTPRAARRFDPARSRLLLHAGPLDRDEFGRLSRRFTRRAACQVGTASTSPGPAVRSPSPIRKRGVPASTSKRSSCFGTARSPSATTAPSAWSASTCAAGAAAGPGNDARRARERKTLLSRAPGLGSDVHRNLARHGQSNDIRSDPIDAKHLKPCPSAGTALGVLSRFRQTATPPPPESSRSTIVAAESRAGTAAAARAPAVRP